jgi:hypothetical protein
MEFADHTQSTAASEPCGRLFTDCVQSLAEAYAPFRFWSDVLLMISAIGQFISGLITVVVRSHLLSLYIGTNTLIDILSALSDE